MTTLLVLPFTGYFSKIKALVNEEIMFLLWIVGGGGGGSTKKTHNLANVKATKGFKPESSRSSAGPWDEFVISVQYCFQNLVLII